MKQDYMSHAMKEKIGNKIIKYVLRENPLMTPTQMRRISCHLYHRFYHKNDGFFLETKKKVMGTR
jgi:hypothetical protein